MKLLEYASKEVMRKFGLPVTDWELVRSVEELERVIDKFQFPVALKAQVPVGGRGKAGGIKIAKDRSEALEKADKIFNLKIKGIPVKKLMVSQAVKIEKEYYIGVVVDRKHQTPTVMVSAEGGVDIEEVARTKPEAIHMLQVDINSGLMPYQARFLAHKIFDDPKLALRGADVILKLYNTFVAVDAQLAEINPLALTKDRELEALDAKIVVDDNALYRHPDLESLRDLDYEDATELEAKEAGLSYVKLDGYIGCCVNGAGLAMATMDLIKHYGGEPANFLDVGGSSNPEKVRKAMELILRDKNVKSIYINIFGGITRCDDVANGLIQAFSQMEIPVPVVVRLTGTNEEIARKMLNESGLPLVTAETMAEGAKKAIELAGKR
ncbi:MAG: ADP-forming succinate--CoA ligase subunit beta [Candidatus Hydrothermota bacterium]|nr:MAG: ADP-forming succinate--CoA ligase subunit beta [Candidatus Hydrothermae bacterium]